jgi:hypothetical protein
MDVVEGCVEHHHLVARCHELLDQVRANEAGAADH